MINNIQAAQPQCGISSADIIYEVLVEGVTRMMAIFSDIKSAEHLGSVRSIRPYFLDISLGYGAISVHAGGSDEAYTRISRENIDDIDGVRSAYPVPNLFYRDQTRMNSGYAIEHTLFTEGDRVYASAEKLGYSTTLPEDYDNGLRFVTSAVPENGESAEKITVNFNISKRTELTYHADTGLYTAKQYGGDYIDGNSKEALSFRNVIAFPADTMVYDGYGRLLVNLITSGEGYYACGGKYEPITWKRDSVSDCFHYYRADGSELTISEGKTYIMILAKNDSTITFE